MGGEERGEPTEDQVDRAQAEKKGDPESAGIAYESGNEQGPEGAAVRDTLPGGVFERNCVWQRVAHAGEQLTELRPAVRAARHKARRLGERTPQHQRKQQRQCATDQVKCAPAIGRQHARGDQAAEHAAERDADDREFDGRGATLRRREFRRQRAGIGHRATGTEPGKETQRGEAGESVHQRRGDRRQTKQCHRADQRRAAAEAITKVTRHGAADGHAR